MIQTIFAISAIKVGLRQLLKFTSSELTKNKTRAIYLQNRDAGDTNYLAAVTIPALLGKLHTQDIT